MARPTPPKRRSPWTGAARRLWNWASGRSAARHEFHDLKARKVVIAGDIQAADALQKKLNELRRSFEGASELCYLHAELIVKLRRGIDTPASWETFTRLWEQETDFLCANLNSRWLISALDTFAGHGEPVQQARALIPIAFFNAIRIAQTERVLVGAEQSSQAPEMLEQREIFELWDGIETYNFRRGDVVWNMLERIRCSLGADRVIAAIFETLLDRALRHDTLIGRISRRSEHPRRERPKLPDSSS